MQRQGRKVDFTGQDIYVGIDVHKDDWTVTIRTSVGEFKTFRQVADPDHLHRYLVRAFPGATFHAVYEAGFSGFWAYDRLTELGIETMVVHPPDIPTRDKDRRKKADRTDSRKLARHLQAGELDPIYVPEPEHRFARDLVRSRMAAVKKQTRVKNQIHSLLDRHGVRIPAELHPRGCWSRALLRWLEREPFHGQPVAQRALRTYVDEIRYWRERVKELGAEIRRLGRSEPYREVVEVLRTLPGIGTLSAVIWVVELVDVRRFRHLDQLASYVGLVPSIYQSGDKEWVGRVTRRGHPILRPLILENTWTALRRDPYFLDLYQSRLRRGVHSNCAIIAVAKRLLSRIRHAWLTGQPYVPGVVG